MGTATVFAVSSWAAPLVDPTPTPTFVPRTCGVSGASSITLQARLLTISLPLSGVQHWRFGVLNPDGTRGIEIRPSESHFNCTAVRFSGQNIKTCARLDPASPARGVVDCGGGNLTGYHSLMEADHNTNQATVGGQPNGGLPADPNCTNTYSAPDGTVLDSCLEGTDPACSGGAHTHVGVCNSPAVQTLAGTYPAGGFHLFEAIDVSFGIGSDCSTPCPADDTPLQPDEFQIAGELTSGEAKGVIWQANNTALTLGTTGTPSCPIQCLVPPCCPSFAGTPFSACLPAPPATLDGAQAVLAYPVLDPDPTTGDFIAALKLECGPTPVDTQPPPPTATATPTPSPSATPAEVCAPAPRAACQLAQTTGFGLNTTARTMHWKWRGGSTPISLVQFGDPVGGVTAYHLCVYDTGSGPPSLAVSAKIPAGGTCGTRPCWKQVRNRFSYANPAATPDGIRRMTLQPSGRAAAAIAVSARGANLHLPVPAAAGMLFREFPQVIVQLQRSDSAACWEAVYASPPIRDTGTVFADIVR